MLESYFVRDFYMVITVAKTLLVLAYGVRART